MGKVGAKVLVKIIDKRTIFVLCVMLLNLIDYFRESATGDVWKTAANCTGIVVAILIVSKFKKGITPTIYDGIWTAICIVTVPLIVGYWKKHLGECSLGQMLSALSNVWIIALIWARIVIKSIREKNFSFLKNWQVILWIAFAAISLLGGSGKIWPVWTLALFGMFYLTQYGYDDTVLVCDAMIDGTIISFFFVQTFAYAFRPFDLLRYYGAYANCNDMARYYLMVFAFCLCKIVKLTRNNAKIAARLFYYAGATGMCAFMFLTGCRSAWLCAVAVYIFFLIFEYRKQRKMKRWKIAVYAFYFTVGMVAMVPIVYATVRYLPTIHPHPIWYEGEWNENRVHSWDPWNSEKYTSLGDVITLNSGRLSQIIGEILKKSPGLLSANAQEIVLERNNKNEIPNSIEQRYIIWQTYLKSSNLFGKSDSDCLFIWDIGIKVWHAQNIFIQFIYNYGYIGGGISIILIMSSLISSFVHCIKNYNYASLMCFFVCLIFVLFGMFEIVWNPGQLIFTMFFMVQHPGIRKIKCNNSEGY